LASLAGKRTLYVGCGGGLPAKAMARRGADVLEIDLADKGLCLKVAAIHAAECKASVAYRHVAAEDLAREVPGSFDVVTCTEMLEHVPDPTQVV
jgi:2-polyprenyl-6-hydroxyphenyl methylase/3-demethylubiquinone-9 3-methyltransferase